MATEEDTYKALIRTPIKEMQRIYLNAIREFVKARQTAGPCAAAGHPLDFEKYGWTWDEYKIASQEHLKQIKDKLKDG